MKFKVNKNHKTMILESDKLSFSEIYRILDTPEAASGSTHSNLLLKIGASLTLSQGFVVADLENLLWQRTSYNDAAVRELLCMVGIQMFSFPAKCHVWSTKPNKTKKESKK